MKKVKKNINLRAVRINILGIKVGLRVEIIVKVELKQILT